MAVWCRRRVSADRRGVTDLDGRCFDAHINPTADLIFPGVLCVPMHAQAGLPHMKSARH